MKKKVAFQKQIEFPTMIGEISAISLEQDLHFVISVDGGISEDTIKSLKENKLDRIVAGSYVCKSANFDKQIEKLENVVK